MSHGIRITTGAPEAREARPARQPFYVGLDLGQSADFTAVAILERAPVAERKEPDFHVRHLERFPLGTSYPDVVGKVRTMLEAPELAGNARLLVDQTGVGRPVVDMLLKEGLKPIAVTITGGNEVQRDPSGYRVPKRDLASTLQVLLQNRRLHVARSLPEAAVLTKELLGFKVKISVAGHDSYEAWREGVHDDLVLAVAMAAWYGCRAPQSRPALRFGASRSAAGVPGGWRGHLNPADSAETWREIDRRDLEGRRI